MKRGTPTSIINIAIDFRNYSIRARFQCAVYGIYINRIAWWASNFILYTNIYSVVIESVSKLAQYYITNINTELQFTKHNKVLISQLDG